MTNYQGISDREVIDLANSSGGVALTRDRDFLGMSLRREDKYGLVHVAER